MFSICEGHDTAKVRDMYDLQKTIVLMDLPYL